MTNTSPPPWGFWHDPYRRPPNGPDIRVSDAERAAVGETLSKHYADGRLDDAEFKERIDRAMSAKTRSDLGRLTTDLPPLDAPAPPVPRRRPIHILAAVLVGAIVISALSAPFYTPHVPFLILLVLAVLLWRRLSGRSFHHHHSHPAAPPYS